MTRFAMTLAAAALALPTMAFAQERPACFDVPEPVVSLDYGSRYTDDSKDRSDIDEKSNRKVDAALGPIDDFIIELSSAANAAAKRGGDAEDAAACVVSAIDEWAAADAMSELDSENANMTIASRIGGIAMAYLQAEPVADVDPETEARIETWLRQRARHVADWFDDEAPPMASRNNLRAWAAYAAATAGKAAGDDYLTSWAAHSLAVVACPADDLGALPLEMKRGPRAMHYQLHATSALVVTAALLDGEGYRPFELCDRAIPRIAGFVPKAMDDPSLVEERAGEAQTIFEPDSGIEAYQLAWAEAYLSIFDAPEIAEFVKDYRPLSNSKLGGDQSALW